MPNPELDPLGNVYCTFTALGDNCAQQSVSWSFLCVMFHSRIKMTQLVIPKLLDDRSEVLNIRC